MPQFSATNVKALLTGGSTLRVDWDRKKKSVAANIDTSVFKDGLGPAMDKLSAAIKASNAASSQLSRIPELKRIYGEHRLPEAERQPRPVEDPKITAARTKARDQADKAREAVLERFDNLDRVLRDYQALVKKKISNPKDKLSKPNGKTAPDMQKAAWELLEDFLEQATADVKQSVAVYLRRREGYTTTP